MPKLAAIAFDADDTLWQNEQFFRLSQDRFAELLADFTPRDHLEARLLAAERRNIGHYGFGVKGFTLSMIETAIEVTDDRVPAHVIRELIGIGRDMLAHPIELLPHVRPAIEQLAERHPLVLITKGDLLDQERKLAQSGLGELFSGVEIVSDKKAPVYARIFDRLQVPPNRAMMVGNSLKSDVLPVLEIGGWGIHIPHDLTWALEHEVAPDRHPRFRVLADLRQLPDLVARIDAGEQPIL